MTTLCATLLVAAIFIILLLLDYICDLQKQRKKDYQDRLHYQKLWMDEIDITLQQGRVIKEAQQDNHLLKAERDFYRNLSIALKNNSSNP